MTSRKRTVTLENGKGDEREMSDRVHIPAAFWKVLSKRDQRRVMETGCLDGEDCATLWALLGREDAPPRSLGIEVNADDIMRLWPPTPDPQRS